MSWHFIRIHCQFISIAQGRRDMKGYLLSVEFRFNSNCCECVTLGYSVTIGYDNDDNLEILSCLITQISVPPTRPLTQLLHTARLTFYNRWQLLFVSKGCDVNSNLSTKEIFWLEKKQKYANFSSLLKHPPTIRLHLLRALYSNSKQVWNKIKLLVGAVQMFGWYLKSILISKYKSSLETVLSVCCRRLMYYYKSIRW